MTKEFSSLHNHSHFSLMDGISLPEEIIKTAKEKNIKSIALTDHGHCHGHADFYIFGKKHGVRTILGMEAYVIHDLDEWRLLKERLSTDKKQLSEMDDEDESSKKGSSSRELYKKGHLVILARNREGLSNLYQLTYKAHKIGMYGKPRCDKKMLREHSAGLIATSACMGGVIGKKLFELIDNKCSWSDIITEAKEFEDIFGKGHFFLELQFNESVIQKELNKLLIKISNETGIPLTVATDSHYVNPADWEAQEILYMLRGNKTLATRGDWAFDIRQLYVKSGDEMWQSFLQFNGDLDVVTVEKAFQNTLLIDSLVEDFEPDTHQRLPTLPVENPFKQLGLLAIDELKRRGLDENKEYLNRLMHELKIIKEKGTSNYFLITRQIVNKAKEKMLVGAGRGSAAGSLTCYMLGITDLDPIKHGLLFERFLDPTRVENPDIDVDFEDADEAKEMLRQMFGEDNVACLSTYGTFQIKGLLKDLARVYDLDHNEVNRVNKKIESELRVLYHNQDKSTIVIKLEDIERVSPAFNNFVEEYPEVGTHLKKLYGRNRHVGRHACGVIIGDNLAAETAIFCSKGVVQASFTEGIVNKNISTMGFVKFDILSIATLKVIDHALHLIADRTGKQYSELRESIRPHNLDLDDMNVIKKIFWEGNFAGIFQFTEKGIRRLAMKIKPEGFKDVSAICSLYRPGPLGSGMDKLYFENKQNKDNIKYDHPVLEQIMGHTYGCLVYQEQLMQVCQLLGKMEFKDVQRVRKVLLKKDKSKGEEFLKKEGEELKGKFILGCKENGLTEQKAEEWWKNLLYFGGYGFNKAHSDAYTVMTMQTAFLATYYPLEFYSAVLTCAQSGEMQEYVGDIKRRGIHILPVDVNSSKKSHVIESDCIRLSLNSVLGIGPAAIEKIVENQPYNDFIDFLDRSGVGKTAIQPLILIGAFDSIVDVNLEPEPNIKAVEVRYEIYCSNQKYKSKKMRGEWLKTYSETGGGLIEDYKLHEKVFFEINLLGFSLRGSPFEILDRDKKIKMMFDDISTTYKEFVEGEELVAMLPVVAKDIRERAQRNGQMMAFLKFGVESGEEFDCPCFATIWKHIGNRVKKGSVYVATFNRKEEDPFALMFGKPGFAHSARSANDYLIDVDEISL
jgi:DNA polymerase-3 subunit alpha